MLPGGSPYDLVERPQRLVRRARAEDERPVEPRRTRGRVTRDPGVVKRPLGGDEVLVVLHSEVRCICEEAPEQCEPPRVAALLLERQRRTAELSCSAMVADWSPL